jgi:glycosyltransferase involved in cell wall biosynthesis
MRVLYVHRQEGRSVGGAVRALGRMLAAVRQRGIVPTLLFTRDVQDAPEFAGIPARRLSLPPARKGKSLPFYPGALLRLRRFLKAERPDVIHLNDLDDTIFFTIAGGMAGGVPVVATARSYLDSEERFRKLRAHRLDRLVCVSGAVRDQAIRAGIPAGRTVVVHDPVDPRWTEWPTEEERGRWRERLGLREGAPVIGTVGNLSPVKGTDVLVRALPVIVSRYPDARCVIVGADDRNLRPSLDALAASLGVAGSVRFAGPLADPRPAVSLMDIFVLPSRLEGYGLALLEAMSYGRPVVASRIGGVTDIIGGDEFGVLVPPDDPDALGNAVADLLGDPERRRGLGRAGADRVRKEFGESGMEELCLMYRSLLPGAVEASIGPTGADR